MTVDATTLATNTPLRVYVDLHMREGEEVLRCVEQYGVPYYYVPTRWAQPKVSYGPIFITGVDKIREFLEDLMRR